MKTDRHRRIVRAGGHDRGRSLLCARTILTFFKRLLFPIELLFPPSSHEKSDLTRSINQVGAGRYPEAVAEAMPRRYWTAPPAAPERIRKKHGQHPIPERDRPATASAGGRDLQPAAEPSRRGARRPERTPQVPEAACTKVQAEGWGATLGDMADGGSGWQFRTRHFMPPAAMGDRDRAFLIWRRAADLAATPRVTASAARCRTERRDTTPTL